MTNTSIEHSIDRRVKYYLQYQILAEQMNIYFLENVM